MFATLARFCALSTALAFVSQAPSANELPRVKVANGVLVGVEESDGLRVFKGVPFAAPPVGELRWREPQPVNTWKGERRATEFGARCMQRRIYDDMVFRTDRVSEDCLYLNVWTPAKSASEKLPVLVYFYGGGFLAGDGSEPRYDGASMARKGIVALTVNYRLDVFGSFAHPELTKESPHRTSGNYMMLDQHAALQWVQENITAFGGDPQRVTIAGESAGSMAVSALMASPLTRDLIAGAIGESGALIAHLLPLSAAEETGVRFAAAAGVDSLAALRVLPAERLLEVAANFEELPPIILDGFFFPKSPSDIFASGEQAKVPLLAGSNSQESSFEELLEGKAPTAENYRAMLDALYGAQAEHVAALYPASSEEQVKVMGTELASDRFLGYSTWKWLDLHGRTSDKPAFYYYYAHPRPAPRADPKAAIPSGAVHSGEIEYAMGNLESNEVFAWTADDHKVSQVMQEYFANFIKRGDPNGSNLPRWPAYYSEPFFPRMTIDANTRLGPDTRRVRYQLLDAIERAR